MTTSQAKKIIRSFLLEHNLPFTKLTARTIGFSDLARGSSIFVKIHGWQPNPVWDELKTLAHRNGFCVEA
jgi:hypothetical protein